MFTLFLSYILLTLGNTKFLVVKSLFEFLLKEESTMSNEKDTSIQTEEMEFFLNIDYGVLCQNRHRTFLLRYKTYKITIQS
jgi:hypothetical protein